VPSQSAEHPRCRNDPCWPRRRIRFGATALARDSIGVAKSVHGSFVISTITGLLFEITD
jgi:hypothetical protein